MPALGRAWLHEWLLDPAVTYLNHGTVGATPRRVLAAQQAIRDDIERHPARYLLRELTGAQPAPWRPQSRLREAIQPVAAFVGAQASDIVFVPSVTVGMNAVLQSIRLAAGDEIVATSLAYGAVALTIAAVAERTGAVVRLVTPTFPPRSPGDLVDDIRAALTDRTRLVVVDHVTAQTALVLPVADLAEACHARGVPVLVDGAHAPGSIPLDITALGVDWYTANLHKWAHTPRSCGFLWAHPERQAIVRHPIVSWGSGRGFVEEFENQATHDPSCALSAPTAIALLHEWDWPRLAVQLHDLAWDAGRRLTDRWGTALTTPESMVGAMITVPLPTAAGTSDGDATRLRLALLEEDRIEVQLHASHGRLWVRVSCQAYTELADIERLADAVVSRTTGRA